MSTSASKIPLSEQLDLSVVIPVFNAEACLGELYRRLINSIESLGLSFEIILIEDCGRDKSWELIQELSAKDSRVKGFKLSRNFGQHNAITAGLDQACGKSTLIMDCDLQDRPEDIPHLIDKMCEGYDVVIARSTIRHQTFFNRLLARLFYSVFTWLSGYTYEDGVRSFRIMSSGATRALKSMREQMRSIGPLGIWIGFPTAYLEVTLSSRYAGKSSYGLMRLLTLALRNLIAFSDKPLRISVGVGFLMAACAFSYGLYTFIRAIIIDIPVPGWTSLITSLYFIGGLILANLGVVGIYLGKTFEETKGRPLYIIARQTSENTAIDSKKLHYSE